jgi:hypothetical protein
MQCKKLQRQILQMPIEVQGWDCYQGLVGEVKNLLTVLPLVNLLHSPCMEDRHWRELKIATGKHFSKDASFCLSNLLDLELHRYVTEVEYIVELATKESKIAGQLKRIESQWSNLELQFGTSAKSDVGVIQRPDEILATLEENMAALQGMQGQGKYVEHFISEVNKWSVQIHHPFRCFLWTRCSLPMLATLCSSVALCFIVLCALLDRWCGASSGKSC